MSLNICLFSPFSDQENTKNVCRGFGFQKLAALFKLFGTFFKHLELFRFFSRMS